MMSYVFYFCAISHHMWYLGKNTSILHLDGCLSSKLNLIGILGVSKIISNTSK